MNKWFLGFVMMALACSKAEEPTSTVEFEHPGSNTGTESESDGLMQGKWGGFTDATENFILYGGEVLQGEIDTDAGTFDGVQYTVFFAYDLDLEELITDAGVDGTLCYWYYPTATSVQGTGPDCPSCDMQFEVLASGGYDADPLETTANPKPANLCSHFVSLLVPSLTESTKTSSWGYTSDYQGYGPANLYYAKGFHRWFSGVDTPQINGDLIFQNLTMYYEMPLSYL